MNDWHWWCDPCDIAEAHLSKGDAIDRASRHDATYHERRPTARRKEFVAHESAAQGQSDV